MCHPQATPNCFRFLLDLDYILTNLSGDLDDERDTVQIGDEDTVAGRSTWEAKKQIKEVFSCTSMVHADMNIDWPEKMLLPTNANFNPYIVKENLQQICQTSQHVSVLEINCSCYQITRGEILLTLAHFIH